MMKNFSLFLLLFISISSCEKPKLTLPFYNTPDFSPIFIDKEERVADVITHHIGDFEMKNQNNQSISKSTIQNKIHIANFIFTSCGSICPVMTENMKIVHHQFEDDNSVNILSFSVTPWIDNVEVLKEYTEKNNIKSDNWHFLTGKKSEIYSLARTSYFAEEDLGFTKDSTEFLHTEHVILVDQKQRIRGIYNGTLRLEMKQLIQDINALQEEQTQFF
ncbi:SCO family protein [Flammeovirga yaeyamensis]|nr:SCO family protein [Flammeovirga yaeyamensis]MBB3695893.1 protein SCO1/2 [Flammeovirga yaeyamensis]